jgi:arsenate reductase-like glutaredoxin family protein
MLSHEIAPYAQAHIQELGKTAVEIESFMVSSNPPSREALEDWFKAVTNASRALYRFQVVMTDKVDS